MLDTLGKLEAEQYGEFWDEFGQVLKEGVAEDFANKEALLKLLRFASTHDEEASQRISLPDYVGRMGEGQEPIYYLIAESDSAARQSPHLEVFPGKGHRGCCCLRIASTSGSCRLLASLTASSSRM